VLESRSGTIEDSRDDEETLRTAVGDGYAADLNCCNPGLQLNLMHGDVYANRVFHKPRDPMYRGVYRQVAIVEGTKTFQVQINDSNQVPKEPRFQKPWSGSTIRNHRQLMDAIGDVHKETIVLFKLGWVLYDPLFED
jgi:hypothetical protein